MAIRSNVPQHVPDFLERIEMVFNTVITEIVVESGCATQIYVQLADIKSAFGHASRSYRHAPLGTNNRPDSQYGLVLARSFIFEHARYKGDGAEANMNFSRYIDPGKLPVTPERPDHRSPIVIDLPKTS